MIGHVAIGRRYAPPPTDPEPVPMLLEPVDPLEPEPTAPEPTDELVPLPTVALPWPVPLPPRMLLEVCAESPVFELPVFELLAVLELDVVCEPLEPFEPPSTPPALLPPIALLASLLPVPARPALAPFAVIAALEESLDELAPPPLDVCELLTPPDWPAPLALDELPLPSPLLELELPDVPALASPPPPPEPELSPPPLFRPVTSCCGGRPDP